MRKGRLRLLFVEYHSFLYYEVIVMLRSFYCVRINLVLSVPCLGEGTTYCFMKTDNTPDY